MPNSYRFTRQMNIFEDKTTELKRKTSTSSNEKLNWFNLNKKSYASEKNYVCNTKLPSFFNSQLCRLNVCECLSRSLFYSLFVHLQRWVDYFFSCFLFSCLKRTSLLFERKENLLFYLHSRNFAFFPLLMVKLLNCYGWTVNMQKKTRFAKRMKIMFFGI